MDNTLSKKYKRVALFAIALLILIFIAIYTVSGLLITAQAVKDVAGDQEVITCSRVAQYGDVIHDGVWNCQMPNGDTCYITGNGIDCVQY